MIVINLYGGPGVGKSMTSAQLFYKMKKFGYKVELVTEYAKDLVYSEEFFKLKDQLMVFAKQHHKLWKLRDKVDYAIVDSPLPLSLVYAPDDMIYSYKDLSSLIMSTYNQYDNKDFFLTRSLEEYGYQEYGRHQTLEQALEKDDEILETLIAYGIQHRTVDYKNACSSIMSRLGI